MKFYRWFLSAILCLLSAIACAQENLPVCFNYGCSSEIVVVIGKQQMAVIAELFKHIENSEQERDAMAQAIAAMYRYAAGLTPIWADKPGNLADEETQGRMDCIDHSRTTTAMLKIMEKNHLLKYHRILPSVRRNRVIFQHFSAAIEVLGEDAETARYAALMLADCGSNCNDAHHMNSFSRTQNDANNTPAVSARGQRFVIDSWFVAPGEAPVIMPLDDWLNGGGPDVW